MGAVTRWIGVAMVAVLGGCTLSPPFEGPAVEGGKLVGLPNDQTVVVAITEARLRPDVAGHFTFWRQVGKVWDDLEGRPGLLGVSRRLELFGDHAWTITVWRDEEALMDFVTGDVHQTAISEALSTLEQGRFARVSLAAGDLPMNWETAEALLAEQDRTYAY